MQLWSLIFCLMKCLTVTPGEEIIVFPDSEKKVATSSNVLEFLVKNLKLLGQQLNFLAIVVFSSTSILILERIAN